MNTNHHEGVKNDGCTQISSPGGSVGKSVTNVSVRTGSFQETLCRCHGTVSGFRSGRCRRRASRFSSAADVVIVSAAAGATAVVLGAHLRVHRSNVEQHARLFEPDCTLSTRRYRTTERIVPRPNANKRYYK